MSYYIYNRRLKKRLNTFLKKNMQKFLDFGDFFAIIYKIRSYLYRNFNEPHLRAFISCFSYDTLCNRLYGHVFFLYHAKKDEHQDDLPSGYSCGKLDKYAVRLAPTLGSNAGIQELYRLGRFYRFPCRRERLYSRPDKEGNCISGSLILLRLSNSFY